MKFTRDNIRWGATCRFWGALSLWVAPVLAGESEDHYLTLRDGSVLKIDLATAPAFTVDSDHPPLRTADLSQAVFSPEPAGAVIGQIRKLAADLKAPQFTVRQAASARLLKIAPGFESFLSELGNTSTDPEVRQRMTAILAKTPRQPNHGTGFDRLVTRDGKRLTGDVGAWSTEAKYRGHPLILSRENVAGITRARPDPSALPTGKTQKIHGFTALREDDDGAFPTGICRTGFEADPSGVPLKPGEDISSRFASAGFQMLTSVKGGFVSVNDFTVQGRSKGLSAATHAPLWEGTLTVRFHVPNRPDSPACVTTAGFWIASVSPGGTALEAYDSSGLLVGTVTTKRSGHEFLAFSSPVPIAEIRIVPNPAIDSNYTIDDLFFSSPMPMEIYPEPGWCVVRTRDGERLLATSFSIEKTSLSLHKLSFGAEKIILLLEDIAAFAPPLASGQSKDIIPEVEDLHWILLDDKTRLRATRSAYPEHRWATFPSIKIPSPSIAAFWGSGQSPAPPPESYRDFLHNSLGAVTKTPGDSSRWIALRDAKLGKNWIDSSDRLTRRPTYHESSVVWLDLPPDTNPKLGQVILISGEQISISPADNPGDGAVLEAIDENSATLRIFGTTLPIPIETISSIRFPLP